MISIDTSNNLRICIDAYAIPYINESRKVDSGMLYTMSSSPKNDLNEFIYTQIDITRGVLLSFSGQQLFKKNWCVKINFPNHARNILVDNQYEVVDIGSNSIIKKELPKQ